MTDSQEDHAATPTRSAGGTATIARAVALAVFGVVAVVVWILVPLPSVEEVRAFVDGERHDRDPDHRRDRDEDRLPVPTGHRQLHFSPAETGNPDTGRAAHSGRHP